MDLAISEVMRLRRLPKGIPPATPGRAFHAPAGELFSNADTYRGFSVRASEPHPFNLIDPEDPLPAYEYSKRTLDIVGGFFGLILSAPIVLTAGLAIAILYRCSPFFVHQRVGFRGRIFKMIKLQTMRPAADQIFPDMADHKVKNDPRMTPLGRWLRKLSIDEMPQFWNIIRGDMSLVGPRPRSVQTVRENALLQGRRLNVRPGLTGWSQVNGRDKISMQEAVMMDINYIQVRNMKLDLIIILKTLLQVPFGKDAV